MKTLRYLAIAFLFLVGLSMPASAKEATTLGLSGGPSFCYFKSTPGISSEGVVSWNAGLELIVGKREHFEWGLATKVQNLRTLRGMRHITFSFSCLAGYQTTSGKNNLAAGGGLGFCVIPPSGDGEFPGGPAVGPYVNAYLRYGYQISPDFQLTASLQPALYVGYYAALFEGFSTFQAFVLPLYVGFAVRL